MVQPSPPSFPERFISPNRSSRFPAPAPGTQQSSLWHLTSRGPHRSGVTVSVLWCRSYFTWPNALKVHPHCSMCQIHSLLRLNNTPSYGWTTKSFLSQFPPALLAVPPPTPPCSRPGSHSLEQGARGLVHPPLTLPGTPSVPLGQNPSFSAGATAWPFFRARGARGMPGRGHRRLLGSPGLRREGVREVSHIPCLPEAKFPTCYLRGLPRVM